MNTLSWFLYFADVLANVQFTLVIIGSLLLLAYVFLIFVAYVNEDKFPKFSIAIAAVCCMMAASVLPSKNTMYAIAASELGEETAKSAIGQKSLKAIEQWIDKQLESK